MIKCSYAETCAKNSKQQENSNPRVDILKDKKDVEYVEFLLYLMVFVAHVVDVNYVLLQDLQEGGK